MTAHATSWCSLGALTIVLANAVAVAAPAASSAGSRTSGRAGRESLSEDVSLNDTKRIDFLSRVNGRAYAIEVSLPAVAPPADGYPVIYVLDGDFFFQSVVEAARMNARNAVVVGLGYTRSRAWTAGVKSGGGRWPPNARMAFFAAVLRTRFYDLTPATDQDTLKEMNADGWPATQEDFAGADDFLKTIETEVKPRVYALAKIDKDRQTLFGHSLGGLTVLEALFTEPKAFRTFVASSPSIWWADRAVLLHEPSLVAAVSEGRATPRVLITVGAEEQGADIAKGGMVDNACDLARRLKAVPGAKGYEVSDCAVFASEDHGASPWSAIGRAMTFAFPH